MYNIRIRNCGLVSYGTVQIKWSTETMWPGLFHHDGVCRQTQNAPPNHSQPCMYQTIWCPNSDHITNPHHSQHLKSRTKYY